MPDQTALNADQSARADALDRARRVLVSGSGPLNTGTAPDADQLIQVARWIMRGDDEDPDELDGKAFLDRMATRPEHETQRLLVEGGWLPDTDRGGE